MRTWNFDTVKAYLDKRCVYYQILEHAPVRTITEVRETLHMPYTSMAKTLVMTEEYGRLVAVVLPGSKKLNYGALARTLKTKRTSLRFADADKLKEAGLIAGAISPFSGTFTQIVIDVVLLSETTLYCGSGDHNKTINISPSEFMRVTTAVAANIGV